MNSDVWVVLPVKGIRGGKSRLSGALDRAARTRLNRWLLNHMMSVVREWHGDLSRTVVVTPCPETEALAGAAGAVPLHEADGGKGQNVAASRGAVYAARNRARQVLILAADLPLLCPDALELLARAAGGSEIVLAPDKRGTGTNALWVGADTGFDYRFGRRSLERHAAQAAARGWRIGKVVDPRLAFDVDTPGDYADWVNSGGSAPHAWDSTGTATVAPPAD